MMEQADKKKHIIDTAENLFSDKGFHGTSIRDIADEAGINVAMISYYFGSKEKLLQAIFEKRTQLTKLQLENLLSDERVPPIEKIYKIIDDFSEKIITHQKFYKIMIREQMLEKNSFINKMLIELKIQNTELFEKIIKDGQKKGAFKKGIDVVLLINTLFGTMMQSLINKDFYRDKHNYTSLSDDEFQQLLKKKLRSYLKVLFKAILSYEA